MPSVPGLSVPPPQAEDTEVRHLLPTSLFCVLDQPRSHAHLASLPGGLKASQRTPSSGNACAASSQLIIDSLPRALSLQSAEIIRLFAGDAERPGLRCDCPGWHWPWQHPQPADSTGTSLPSCLNIFRDRVSDLLMNQRAAGYPSTSGLSLCRWQPRSTKGTGIFNSLCPQ